MKRNDSVRRPTVPALNDVHHTNAELPISNHHGLSYIIDPTGMIKSIDNIYKRTRINLSSNQSFFSYLDEISQPTAKEAIDLVFTGMPTNSFSAHARKGDGSSQYLSIIVSPLIYNEGIKMVSLICHEIEFPEALSEANLIDSEADSHERDFSPPSLKQENEELRRVNQFLDNFVMGAAHDLRSPLVVLKTFPDLIRRFTDEKRRHKALDTMKAATIKMEHILDCMMQFVEAQKNEAQKREELDFSEMFDIAFGRLCFELEGINPIFVTDFEQAPKVSYYRVQLNSIIYNLISNAVKYRRKNTPIRIEITTKQEGDFVLLQIKDNGIGMDLEQYGHLLFQPFQRLNNNSEGVGLGLSMIKNNLEFHGGTIKVQSKESEGSTFTVYLNPN